MVDNLCKDLEKDTKNDVFIVSVETGTEKKLVMTTSESHDGRDEWYEWYEYDVY